MEKKLECVEEHKIRGVNGRSIKAMQQRWSQMEADERAENNPGQKKEEDEEKYEDV